MFEKYKFTDGREYLYNKLAPLCHRTLAFPEYHGTFPWRWVAVLKQWTSSASKGNESERGTYKELESNELNEIRREMCEAL